MNTEQTTTVTAPDARPKAAASTASAPTGAPTASRFVPPRLTKLGKVADLTQGGLGGSGLGGELDFP